MEEKEIFNRLEKIGNEFFDWEISHTNKKSWKVLIQK